MTIRSGLTRSRRLALVFTATADTTTLLTAPTLATPAYAAQGRTSTADAGEQTPTAKETGDQNLLDRLWTRVKHLLPGDDSDASAGTDDAAETDDSSSGAARTWKQAEADSAGTDSAGTDAGGAASAKASTDSTDTPQEP